MAAPVAVVTGAARGIGLAIAERFLADGKRLVLIDKDGPALARAARRLGHAERVLAIRCDVSREAQVKAAVRTAVRRFGRIDALVNNAGIAIFRPILETTLADWDKVMRNNLYGAFICSQACAPVMLRGKESISLTVP